MCTDTDEPAQFIYYQAGIQYLFLCIIGFVLYPSTISTEEMMYYILSRARQTRRNGYFDVRIVDFMDPKDAQRSILVSINDNGTPFCPIRTYDEKFYEQPEFEKELGPVLLNYNCSDIKYSHVNGINSTLMTFRYRLQTS